MASIYAGGVTYGDARDVYAIAEPRRRRRRRDLRLLPEVPMDVLIEVYTIHHTKVQGSRALKILLYLEPKDLLTLSRANKGFRRALINETTDRAVWKVKRIAAAAPVPPPRYSEAKWISFLFNTYCHVSKSLWLYGA